VSETPSQLRERATLIDNLRGMCAYREATQVECRDGRELRDFCTPTFIDALLASRETPRQAEEDLARIASTRLTPTPDATAGKD
jgi:hypothetical protein